MRNIIKNALIMVVIVACFMRCCAKKEINNPIDAHPYSFQHVKKFLNTADTYGIDTKEVGRKIDQVLEYPLNQNLLGIYIPSDRHIVINSSITRDSITLKKTLYHELGHLYGLKHDSIGIMSTYLTPQEIHKMYCPLEGGSDEVWKKDVDNLMKEIKRKQDSINLVK